MRISYFISIYKTILEPRKKESLQAAENTNPKRFKKGENNEPPQGLPRRGSSYLFANLKLATKTATVCNTL